MALKTFMIGGWVLNCLGPQDFYDGWMGPKLLFIYLFYEEGMGTWYMVGILSMT